MILYYFLKNYLQLTFPFMNFFLCNFQEILVVVAVVIVAMITIIIVTLPSADIMRIIIEIIVHLNEVVDQENLYPPKPRCHPGMKNFLMT